jgi:Tfp pilus assembly protein PilF
VVGDHAGCAAALERSLALQPDNPTVLNNHAWYLALQGEQLDRAEACSRRALELSPGNANLLDTRAWVLHRMGRNAEALVAMEEAVRMSEWPDPVFLEHLGEIRWALGDADGAREAWRAAIEAGSTSPDLPAKLNQLP